MIRVLLTCLFLLALPVRAQDHDHAARLIDFPDVPGYLTLKVDLHLHTVFSDGSVWPDIRVQEAVRDGLDAIAVTDHIEYQPHRDDIPHPDRNRSYDLAVQFAEEEDLIVIRGSEITRAMPPGHSNAVFLSDVNPLVQDDAVEAFRQAGRQGAFIFWNHPMWEAQVPSGVATLTDMHRSLLDEGLLHGIEVVNSQFYSDEALQIALDHDLTILGTSDVHGLVDWDYEIHHGGHRPVTLVFATERSADGIKEALVDGRTAVWFDDLLIGRAEYVVPLVGSALEVTEAKYLEDTSVLSVVVENHSDAPFVLANRSEFTLHAHADLVTIEPHAETELLVKTLDTRERIELHFEVINAVTAPETHPEIALEVAVTPPSSSG